MIVPFDEVVGQDDAKLALRLAAVDPALGGVLLRGEKGSGKTTLVRGFATRLDAPFVELPLGATEDRVVGTLDTRAALVDGDIEFSPGLLAAAHGGVLYVDEINLLADHLVDLLLDVAVSGENVVERDGLSHRHPARFVLVGSMNPEEGELRPQLLDRFGLCVEVRAPASVPDRVEAVRRTLAVAGDRDPDHARPWKLPAGAESAEIPETVLTAASELAIAVGAEGLRADLSLCRASRALATLDGRPSAGEADLQRIAPLVLVHRGRRGPFDPPVIPDQLLRGLLADQADTVDGLPPGDNQDANTSSPPYGRTPSPGYDTRPLPIGEPRRPDLPQPRHDSAGRGRTIGSTAAGPTDPIAVTPTVRALAGRRATNPGATVGVVDLHTATRVAPRARCVVLCVDLSGSMGADDRARAASGTVSGLLADSYERRDRVAVVGFSGEGARVVVAPTSSIEVARNRLEQLETGGETPLADGLREALRLARSESIHGDVVLAVLTDGRATGAPDARQQALGAAEEIGREPLRALVFDCEFGHLRLGLAREVAAAMGARHVPAESLDAERLTDTIRYIT